MPTLIQNYKKHEVETKLAKFYSVINQAVKHAEVDYGDVAGWEPFVSSYEKDETGNDIHTKPIPKTEYFNKYFAPYLTGIKIQTHENSDLVIVYFQDGSAATFSVGSVIFYPNAKDLTIIAKGDRFGQDKTNHGTKSFVFFFNNTDKSNKYTYAKGVEPYIYSSWNGTQEYIRNHSALGCKENVTQERAFCAKLIQMNGWKIPKDYPLKF